MDLYSVALLVLPTIAMMVLSAEMARARGRSVKAWLWIAFLTGPLPVGPLALYLLGRRKELAC
jgi:hypothetical protein